jgi:hypothetical protein
MAFVMRMPPPETSSSKSAKVQKTKAGFAFAGIRARMLSIRQLVPAELGDPDGFFVKWVK